MVAYSFQRCFVDPIRVGLGLLPLATPPPFGLYPKRHTIRANGKRRHAREGETVQLYCAMRTRQCFKIGEARCTGTARIGLWFDDDDPSASGVISEGLGIMQWGYASLDDFARGDGFQNWQELREFWRVHHPGVTDFDGTIIFWEPMKPNALPASSSSPRS